MLRIKELRTKKKMTQKELAGVVGISQQSLCYYENNVNKPDPDMLIKFADYFECSIDYLVGRADDCGNIITSPELTVGEMQILNTYRKLEQKDRDKTIGFMSAFLYDQKK